MYALGEEIDVAVVPAGMVRDTFIKGDITVEQVFNDFHSVIMSDAPELVDQFIDIYEDTEISDFCQSIKKDIAPVKNAISYNVSSGFVEGNNNKFKLIKRIVYGKSKLVNLFRKCYVAFSVTKEDFTLAELL